MQRELVKLLNIQHLDLNLEPKPGIKGSRMEFRTCTGTVFDMPLRSGDFFPEQWLYIYIIRTIVGHE